MTDTPKTILLVEDESVIAKAQTAILKSYGFDVFIALTGEKAIDIIRTNPAIDLILMDIDLGTGMDGTSTAKEILEIRNIPIVFLTSYSDKETVGKVKDITRYGYVLKGLDDSVVISSIEMALKLFEANRKIQKNEKKYRNIFENVVEGIFQSTPEGKFITVNPAMAVMHGYDSPEHMVKEVASIEKQIYARPEVRNKFIQTLEKFGEAKDFEIEFRRKDDNTFWTSTNARVVKNSKGEVIYYEGTCIDITERKNAVEELKKSELRYRSLVESSSDAIILLDGQKMLYLNPSTVTFFGTQKAEQLIGKNILDFIHPQDRHIVADSIDINRYNKSVATIKEVKFIRNGGESAFIEYTVNSVDYGGSMPLLQIIIRDITRQVEAEKELKRYHEQLESLVEERTVKLFQLNQILEQELAKHDRTEEALRITQFSVDCSANSIFWIGPDACLRYVNNMTCRTLDYSREELLSMTVYDIDPNFPPHAWPEHWEELKKKGSITFESVHRARNGKVFPVEITANYLKHKDQEYNFAFTRDITERKRSEEKVQELNRELTQRIVELKNINQELEAFNYSVSHDLRTPLIAIEGFARILTEKHAHLLDAKGLHCLDVISKSSKRMAELIKDLLNFFSLGRKTIKYSTTDIEKMVNDITTDFKTIYPDQTFHIELKPSPLARADGKMIKQVLVNLIDNAIKYGKPGEPVAIEVGGRIEVDKNIYYVKDNGIGFSRDQADKIFEVFERLHGSDKFEGTGIGLAIAKRIIEKHGGAVWAEAQPDAGATFYFSLPIEKKAIPSP